MAFSHAAPAYLGLKASISAKPSRMFDAHDSFSQGRQFPGLGQRGPAEPRLQELLLHQSLVLRDRPFGQRKGGNDEVQSDQRGGQRCKPTTLARTDHANPPDAWRRPLGGLDRSGRFARAWKSDVGALAEAPVPRLS